MVLFKTNKGWILTVTQERADKAVKAGEGTIVDKAVVSADVAKKSKEKARLNIKAEREKAEGSELAEKTKTPAPKKSKKK